MSNAEDDNSIIWDDTVLIKAYDESINLAREDLARQLASSTNNRAKQLEKEQNSGAASPTSSNKSDGPKSYKVGDFVRAVYDDGVDYEAQIISINNKKDTCVLRYLGYENKQEVPLAALTVSWGKKARKVQILAATADYDEEEKEDQRKPNAEKKKVFKNDFGGFNIPPPPPLPPMFSSGEHSMCDSQHLSAMLMSWYMSGYYTGVFQGVQIAKKETKVKKSK